MLGRTQLDSLPQGAKELMKVMETQASMSGGFNPSHDPRLSLYTMGTGLSLPGSFPSQSTPLQGSTIDTTTESKALGPGSPGPKTTQTSDHGDQLTYVTRKELEQMEERIMSTIERQLKEMEERIVDKILSAKRKGVD